MSKSREQGKVKMEHTPGPWEVGIVRESSITITDAKTTYVATLMDKPGWGDMTANAALIIVAPDLLKACADLLNACDMQMAQAGAIGEVLIAMEQARTVITGLMEVKEG